MKYRLLGRSGLRVSEFALGTMTFGEEWGQGANKEESKRMSDRLEVASRFDPGFPHNFLTDDNIRDIVYGGTHDRIEFPDKW